MQITLARVHLENQMIVASMQWRFEFE